LIAPSEHGSALLDRVLRLADEAEKILALRKERNDFRGANGALGAAAKLLDLCGRLSGELQSANAGGTQHLTVIPVASINIINVDNDADFAAMIGEVTKGFSVDELMRFAGKPHVQFGRRTEASAQARLLRPDKRAPWPLGQRDKANHIYGADCQRCTPKGDQLLFVG